MRGFRSRSAPTTLAGRSTRCPTSEPIHRQFTGPDGQLMQLQPGQALTPGEAVRAATVTAATSLHAPGAGGLAPGEIADFVICDGDPFQHGTRVVQTWIGGRPVWQDKNGQHENGAAP